MAVKRSWNCTRCLKLEKSLLNSDYRNDPDYLDKVLSENFIKYRKSGGVHNKADIIESYSNSYSVLESYDFECFKLSKTVTLITYKTKREKGYTLRSSLWVLEKKQWKQRLHTGTISK